jgi:aminopeptidase Y
MAVLSRFALAASFALSCGVSAAGIQQQSPLTAPSSLSSSHKVVSDYSSKPLISTEALQDAIKIEALVERAKKFYEFAQSSEEDYGHPTRVIGSPGESSIS